jgi:hypothetical protein
MATRSSVSLALRLHPVDVKLLDDLRGPTSRSVYLRNLLHAAAKGGTPKKRKLPAKIDRAYAMELLAEAAQHDARAAVALAEMTTGAETVERLNKIASGD